MSFQRTTSKTAVICIALLVFGTGAFATSSASGPQILAQTTPMESASPEPTAEPATPATQPAPVTPMQTMAPATAPQPATPTTTLPNGTMNNSGTPELMHGGTTGNTNGPNWLDKFNRTPLPEGVERGVSPTTRVKAAKYVKPLHKRVRVKPTN